VRKVPDQKDEWLTLWDLWFQGRKETVGKVAVAVGCTPAEAYRQIYRTDLLGAEPLKATLGEIAGYQRIVAGEAAKLEARLEELDVDGELVDVTRIWRDGSVERLTRSLQQPRSRSGHRPATQATKNLDQGGVLDVPGLPAIGAQAKPPLTPKPRAFNQLDFGDRGRLAVPN
jgi:hypothetical protein